MSRVLKTLLLWLMMVALPLQGMAAVVKASCGPRHHASAEVSAGAAHDQRKESVHHHHDDAMQDMASHDGGTQDAHADTAGTSSYCSACAACCVGAAAPPTIALHWSPADMRPLTLLPAPDSRAASHISSGPERPPKHFSA